MAQPPALALAAVCGPLPALPQPQAQPGAVSRAGCLVAKLVRQSPVAGQSFFNLQPSTFRIPHHSPQ